MAKGRKTGGKPKGYKAPKTIEKEVERERLRQMVCAALEPMTRAQIDHAQGVSYMVLRQKDGTFVRATDVKQLDAALASGPDTFKIFTQAPNVQAFTALTDRALDKPKEQPQDINITGTLDVVSVLKQRHARRSRQS